MAHLFSLIYCSDARGEQTPTLIESIRQAAEQHNVSNNLSGALCAADGSYLQVLEGERRAVSELYRRILMDGRHHRVTLLGAREIVRRDFERWSIWVRHAQFGDASLRALIRRYASGDRFSPSEYSEGQARGFLSDLAAQAPPPGAD